MEDDLEPVMVYSGSIWEAELLKSILEDAEIETFLRDEFTGTLAPWYTAPGGSGSVRVVVSSADFDKARNIVLEFERNLREEK